MNFTSYEEVEVLETRSAVLAVEALVECGGVRHEEGHWRQNQGHHWRHSATETLT